MLMVCNVESPPSNKAIIEQVPRNTAMGWRKLARAPSFRPRHGEAPPPAAAARPTPGASLAALSPRVPSFLCALLLLLSCSCMLEHVLEFCSRSRGNDEGSEQTRSDDLLLTRRKTGAAEQCGRASRVPLVLWKALRERRSLY
jgi:hypothetical protein